MSRLTSGVARQRVLDQDQRGYDHENHPATAGDQLDDDQRDDQRGQDQQPRPPRRGYPLYIGQGYWR